MIRLLHYPLRLFVWLRRFRKRRGYGVHSPFAFQLITRVFFEKGEFYAYSDLERLFPHQRTSDTSLRNDRLLFRLVNDCQPRNMVVVGDGCEISARYLQAGCRRAALSHSSSADDLPAEPIDFLLCSSRADAAGVFGKAVEKSCERSVFVFLGIHQNKAAKRFWKEVERDARTVLTFDLYELGIVYFNPRLNKQSYIVNY